MKKLLLVGVLGMLLTPMAKANPTTIVGVSSSGDDNSWRNTVLEQSFTTDNSSYSDVGFTLSLCNYSATNQGSFSLGLYQDNSGAKGALVASLTTANTAFFTNPVFSDYAFQNILFTNSGITLAPNTTYWVGFSNPDIAWNTNSSIWDNVIEWESLYSITTIGVGTYGDGFADGYKNFSSNNPLNLTVTGTASVPEPSTYALVGLGGLGLVMIATRRKRTA